MTDVVTDMINAIVAAGHATAIGLDIFAMYVRPTPVSQIAVLPSGGLNPIVSTDSTHARPGVQVHIVDSDLASAWNKALGIWNTFSNASDVVGQAIWAARSGPLYMGRQEDGRHKVMVEFQIFA